ncbi:MAG TPA: DUF3300 domain-containing protein [Candidatus Angelobacter sp.]
MLPGNVDLWAQQQQPQQQQPQQQPQQQQAAGSASQDAKLTNDQLDSLVAPIALYPDPLLSQTLVAATYPLEIVQLQQFLEQNKGLKEKALTDAVMKKGWDPSVQAMAPFPDVVKQMAQNIAWTDDLGNAFLAQQNDVMDAVQRMRAKAMEKGALKTTEQQKVETKVVENKTVVVVQPASTEVVYVPTYNPTVVWGAPAYYPYPPIAYPAYPAGGMLLGFGVGVAMGAAWGGGWGWNTGWGGNNDININRNNTFVNNYNRTNAGGRYGGANNRWQHNPAHRGGAPYGNQSVANRYGGSARGNTMAQRQTAARQGQRQLGGDQFRGGNSGANRGGVGGAVSGAGANRSGGNIGSSSGGDRIGNRSASSGNIGSSGVGSGGGDRVGNRSVSNGSMGSRDSSAFSGASGSAARASSARGSSSMGRGGGGSRGGGGRRR